MFTIMLSFVVLFHGTIIWNYIIQPRSEAEQETAKRLDWEEIIAEKTRVKRKYNKNSKESN